MKKLIPFLMLVPALAFAADDVSGLDVLPPEIILALLTYLKSVPYVGPVLVAILKWIAIVTPIMTALSLCAQAILAIPEVVARFQGAHDLADKIKYWSDKIVYWLSYFSIRNAQKPK